MAKRVWLESLCPTLTTSMCVSASAAGKCAFSATHSIIDSRYILLQPLVIVSGRRCQPFQRAVVLSL